MKKHNMSQIFKSKGFYVLLFVGILAIVGVSVVGVNMSARNKAKKNLADLNTPVKVTENKDQKTSIGKISKDATNKTEVAKSEKSTKDQQAKQKYSNDALLEYDIYDGSYAEEGTKDQDAKKETTNDTTKSADAKRSETKEDTAKKEEEESVSVMQPKANSNALHFSKNSLINWPVKGNVIMKFSMDKLIHYATLGEWKCNPAIVISSEVGTDVTAAAKGVVTSVDTTDETGLTVRMDVGDGYELVYGQLSDVSCKVGDTVEQGTVIGKIAEPTMYYSVEGSNLYFQVLNNKEPMNPMLFLTGEE